MTEGFTPEMDVLSCKYVNGFIYSTLYVVADSYIFIYIMTKHDVPFCELLICLAN